ncbi:pentapeptide repeat-containing protein [Streptacidiphilus sp. N1-10]|uniref:Pentapeptide repeat-containing protein n=1 Tax=Streptacidiphilus jeojiensis TaxID=3229225 RepID=A0ABV6XLC6_9ACTN
MSTTTVRGLRRWCPLGGADLSGADLHGANLTRAYLSGATNPDGTKHV